MGKFGVVSARGGVCGIVGLTVVADDALDAALDSLFGESLAALSRSRVSSSKAVWIACLTCLDMEEGVVDGAFIEGSGFSVGGGFIVVANDNRLSAVGRKAG